MAGCGIRSVRWGLESDCFFNQKLDFKSNMNIIVNESDPNRSKIIHKNLRQLKKKGIRVKHTCQLGDVVLEKSYLNKIFFDVIDIDAFGTPYNLLPSLIKVFKFD